MTAEDLPTTRTNSKGQKEVIAEMHYPHLKNATLKGERTDPHNPETKAMRAELDRREDAYAEQQAQEQAQASYDAATAHRRQ